MWRFDKEYNVNIVSYTDDGKENEFSSPNFPHQKKPSSPGLPQSAKTEDNCMKKLQLNWQ